LVSECCDPNRMWAFLYWLAYRLSSSAAARFRIWGFSCKMSFLLSTPQVVTLHFHPSHPAILRNHFARSCLSAKSLLAKRIIFYVPATRRRQCPVDLAALVITIDSLCSLVQLVRHTTDILISKNHGAWYHWHFSRPIRGPNRGGTVSIPLTFLADQSAKPGQRHMRAGRGVLRN
jgi:hypothetical protein